MMCVCVCARMREKRERERAHACLGLVQDTFHGLPSGIHYWKFSVCITHRNETVQAVTTYNEHLHNLFQYLLF
jgi:hypothetical protein